jgi:hypothetical protein
MAEESRAKKVLARAGVLLCLVPIVPVVELLLHAHQTSSVVPDEDWTAARDLVKAQIQPDDLVVFAPFWADPLGRRAFGDAIASREREARSDERRFRRAFEVSIRGAHEPALADWKTVEEKRAGDVTIRLLENPSYTPVFDDVLERLERLTVTRIDASGEQPCTFQRGSTAGGSTVVPQGLLTPAEKLVCSGGHVGIAVLHALDHRPHVCLYATPISGATLHLRFSNVRFGSSLFGHSGIQWVAERTPTPEKVPMTFYGDGHLLGTHAHKVGSGWTGFELPTPELEGKTGELAVEIGSSSQRQFCFEATTRGAP